MLGIARLDAGDRQGARALFEASLAARPTWLGLRQRALVADSDDAAEADYLLAWAEDGAPAELADEIALFMIRADRLAALERFIAVLPADVAGRERISLARAVLAANGADWDSLEAILAQPLATIREGETLSSDLWIALQSGRATEALGRTPTEAELAERLLAFPVPEHLDFRMFSNEEAA